MTSRTQDLKKQQLNLEQWQKLYYQNQQSYLRARLLAIKFLAEGKTRSEVSQLVNCTYYANADKTRQKQFVELLKKTES